MYSCAKIQQTTNASSRSRKRNIGYRVVVCFLELPKTQGACALLRREKLIIGRECLNQLCTFPGGHWIRSNIQCGHRTVKWSAFLNKRPQRGRDGHCGNEVGTLRRGIEIKIDRQIDRNKYRNSALLWLEALPTKKEGG